MKQLLSLFLFLLPCLAWAQYPTNGNQKITLGEQSTADGLIFRGVLADTGNITPSRDTSAYIILDTVNHRFYNYNRATNVWSMAGVGSISSGLTGTLPVANGVTNTSTAFTAGSVVFAGSGGTYSQSNSNFFWDNSLSRLGIGTTSPVYKLHVKGGNGSTLTLDNDGSRFVQFLFTRNTTNNSGADMLLDGTNETFLFRTLATYPIIFSTSATAGNPTERLRINSNGNIGINVTNASARLEIDNGTSILAPLKFQSGTLLTAPEAGAMEYLTTNLYFTPNTAVRHNVNHGLIGSATLNFPSTTTLLSADLTITVTGAADGDVVSLGVPNAAVNANTSYSAWVSAANTVTVRFNNYSSGTVDPASALFKVFVTK